MGKLLTGRYGEGPGAESTTLSLVECHQRLGLKPSDFVSEGAPDFFNKTYNAKGRYLVFQTDLEDIRGSSVWRPGHYLLPKAATGIWEALAKGRAGDPSSARRLPVTMEAKVQPPEPVALRAREWADASQPLFFKCRCDHLELRLDAPWSFRRRWKAHLKCPERCQPELSTLL